VDDAIALKHALKAARHEDGVLVRVEHVRGPVVLASCSGENLSNASVALSRVSIGSAQAYLEKMSCARST
jgi:hypothetical protein